MVWVVTTHPQSPCQRVFRYPILRVVVYERNEWHVQSREVLGEEEVVVVVAAAVAVRGGVVSWREQRHVWEQVGGF